MDKQPNEMLVNVQQVKMDTKRKGFHRNNNDETDNSMILSNRKRIKIYPSTSSSTPIGLLDEELFTQPLLADDDKGLEDELGTSLFISSIDEVHRNNGDDGDSDQSNNSDKFYSKIKAREESAKKGTPDRKGFSDSDAALTSTQSINSEYQETNQV
jgi:hypothetical protein